VLCLGNRALNGRPTGDAEVGVARCPVDDVIDEEHMVGWPIMLLGYPGIPRSRTEALVMAEGHTSAVIDRTDRPYVHYLTSLATRFGFGGSPVLVLDEEPWVMGVVTSVDSPKAEGQGASFEAAVSVEPLWHLFDEYRLAPGANGPLIREHLGDKGG
jgi:hypothetical protein